MCAVALVGLGGLVGWRIGQRGQAERSSELFQESGTVVVAMQKLGQLHTAAYSMNNVLQEETQNEPSDWLKSVPGVESLVHWGTHNRASVTAEGTVEAGIDLSRLSAKDVRPVRQPDGVTRLRVHLPPVTIYPPNVHIHVQAHDAGMFWRDDNIAPKAQEEAGRRFLKAAEQKHIREKAQEGAVEALQKMMQGLHHTDVDFTFE